MDIRHAVTQNATFPQNFIAYDGIADFLANQGEQFSTLGNNLVGVQNTDYSFFIQDDFRVAPRLTLNLGLRYDYFLGAARRFDSELQRRKCDCQPTSSTAHFGPLGAGLYNPDRNDFAPRLGFAWNPYGNGKTVVRGGFGIFYNPALTGEALSLAGNYQQGYNVNILGLGCLALPLCTPPFGKPPPYYYS